MDKVNYSVDELTVGRLIGAGLPAPTAGKRLYLNAATGSDGNLPSRETSPWKTLATAYAAMETLKGDQLYIYPSASSITLAATTLNSTDSTPDFKKSLCSVIGVTNQQMSQRARFGHAVTLSPLLTVSGYGNTFANLYFMHGMSTTDLIGLSITGNYNTFINCHIATPLFAAQGDQATYKGVSVVATGTYFKNCVFGMNTIARTGAYPTVYINAPSNHYGYTIFEDCTFLMQGNTAPFHVYVDNTGADQDETYVDFRGRNRFISTGQNMPAGPTYSITFSATAAAGSTCGVFLSPLTEFINCGMVTSNNYANVWVSTPGLPAGSGHLAGVSIKAT